MIGARAGSEREREGEIERRAGQERDGDLISVTIRNFEESRL